MSLVVNNNLMAANVARNLNTHYGRLQTSTQRLSSGLRINSAADDAAGLAIRELQRADIAALHQGARNANDAISMIQVADGALGVIDEKLIRMKELAEQAATGTYSSTQRLMIESEYQAMASEITRIANATDFNGMKLLDGTLSSDKHDGSGLVSTGKMKIHFGTANDSAEDYYYITIGNCTAAALGVGNSAYVGTGKYVLSETKTTLKDGTEVVKSADDQYVDNTGAVVPVTATLTEARQAADGSGAIYYNDGTGWVAIGTPATPPPSDAEIAAFPQANDANGNLLVADVASGNLYWKPDYVTTGTPPNAVYQGANVTTITTNTEVFKEPAFVDANGKAIDPQPDASEVTAVYKIGNDEFYKATDGSYVNVANGQAYTLPPTATFPLPESRGDYGPKFVTQTGPAPGVAQTTYEQAEFKKADGTYLTAEEAKKVKGEEKIPSDGYTVSTQEAAQKALNAINNAIESKDKIRAHLGAMQNRLENTITNLNVQAENLQAAESRISDVDVATEMTQFVRNQILTQSAVAMLGQANSLPQMAMQLIGG